LIPKGYAVGQAVKRGDILFELTSGTDTLEIEADVPESQIGELHEGMPVTIGVSSYPIFKYVMMSGKVTFVSSVATDAVTFSERLPTASQFRMVIKPDPASFMAFSEDKKILPGMLAEVHVRKKKVAIWRLLLAPFLRLSYRMDT
jgi:epimerase transport system membrane fusion protein